METTDPFVNAAATAIVVNMAVNLLRLAWPTVRSWVVVLCVLAAGLLGSWLLAEAQGWVLTRQTWAIVVLSGIAAAAGAAAAQQVGQNADAKRATTPHA